MFSFEWHVRTDELERGTLGLYLQDISGHKRKSPVYKFPGAKKMLSLMINADNGPVSNSPKPLDKNTKDRVGLKLKINIHKYQQESVD